MAADMVRQGKRVADIGTDHAYLPVYLVLHDISPSCIAADLREKPLENAQETIALYNVEDKVTTVLSDGLSELSPDSADDFIFCGMGGILIAELLEKAPWIKDPDKRLIIQPMRHCEAVRKYLCENGFEIIKEDATEDDNRLYICINAVYTGKNDTCNHYTGKLDIENPYALRYLQTQYNRIRKRYDALKKADIKQDEQAELYDILRSFEECIK